ncbi:MAG: 7-cyano-7-deazaguanine synthase [Armatimonadota bacterium]|nr:7-cyano-7-deazaguanine synthase [Armatimonadota bacterium]MDR7444623.1 7-cyano-7-deazaguanine synthase [Armatimonadota bacterium]MDR7569449.1 7-cyano-7-deazaguanine synthase [Armatimonadota bacterium]MDR7613668.1 7-cyano-7-deazaguanine synthase [Armatimonadota bacterium]
MSTLRESLIEEIRRIAGGQPVVVAFSGGLDSTVVAALAKEALGPEKVLLVTVNMGQYAYRRGNEIVLEMAERLGLPQRCLLGQALQDRIMSAGPACNRCTREIKLGLVKAASRGRLVLTGANRSDTWGKMGLKLCNGIYAPLLDLDKPQIRALAQELGIDPPQTKIGENPGREGCKLKHLLKPLINPDYHGRAVARANEVILEAVRDCGFPAELANVKVIGPLSRNIGLVNLRPQPPREVADRVLLALREIPELDEVHLVDRPVVLVAKANPAILGDPHAQHWLQHGRMQPDFAQPIQVEWLPSGNRRLGTFHVVAFRWAERPEACQVKVLDKPTEAAL